ncbi:MAG TPA: hypothetical protein VIG97_09790, partial [Luteimonas sp.]
PRLRPAAARGRVVTGGVRVTEAFSRADAIDAAWMGWGALRVLSHQEWVPGARRDDGRIANMERLLLVAGGALDVAAGEAGRHRVGAGGALWIGAGHGLEVGLANASPDAPLRLLELWLQPDRVNAAPVLAVRAPGQHQAAAAGWDLLAGGDRQVGDTAPAAPGAAALAMDAPLPLRLRAQVLVGRPVAGACLDIRAGGQRFWLEVLDGEVLARRAGGDEFHLGAGDGVGWRVGDAAAPVAVLARSTTPPAVLLVVLPA